MQTKIEFLEKTKNNCERELLKLREDRAKHSEDKKEEMDKLKGLIKEAGTNKAREMDLIAKNNKEAKEDMRKEYDKEENNIKTMIAQEKTKLAKLRDENTRGENKSKSDKQTA